MTLQIQNSLYLFPILLTACIALVLMIFGWTRRSTRGAGWFTVLMATQFIWALGYAFELMSSELVMQILWAKIQYIGIIVVPVAWVLLALVFSGLEHRVNASNIVLLLIIPLITLTMVWTNEWHELMWMNIGQQADGDMLRLVFERGAWYWVNVVYAYLLLGLGAIALIRKLGGSAQIHRMQLIAILIGSTFPWLGNAAYMANLTPQGLDVTPMAFTLTGITAGWAVFALRLLDITPIARGVLIDSMSDAAIVIDVQRRVTYLNPAACQLFDLDPDKAIGQSAMTVFEEWPILSALSIVEDEIYTQANFPGEYEMRNFDVRVTPIYTRDTITGRLLILREITQRVKVEHELRKYYQVVEQSANGIVITDTEGVIEYINPASLRMSGYSFAEAIGQNASVFGSEETSRDLYTELWKMLRAGHEWHGEFRNQRKNGELYWQQATIAPIKDAGGNVIYFIAVQEDISERKQAEENLHLYTVELESRNAELDAFAHTVAHDLKNPLSVNVSYIDLMQTHFDKLEQDKILDYLDRVRTNALKMNNIINELLLLSSVRTAEMPTEVMDMADVVDGTLHRLSAMIKESNAQITTQDSWPLALGYSPWMEEVLVNFVSNAIKYGGEPPLIELTSQKLPDGTVRFNIKDNGEGLSPEQQALLFTPFTRIGTVRAQGHGLGLSIVQRIMDKLNGSVGVESTPGRGSTFYFVLPAAQEGAQVY